MYRQNKENIGSFIEKEFNHEFTYRNTKDKWAIAQGYRHEIDCGFNGEIRFGNVKKTVAYVLCGDGVEQKWVLAKCTVFKNPNPSVAESFGYVDRSRLLLNK